MPENQIPLNDNDREFPNEYTEVERPLLSQLHKMGWGFVVGDIDYPQKTFRENFRQVILPDKLKQAIRRINLDSDGNEYLDDVTIERAITDLQRTGATSLVQTNKILTEKLIQGVHVTRAEGGDTGRQAAIKFIDFEHLERNDFLAINQFRVDMIGRTGFCIPDVVLFVNGIPLVVIECKSPSIADPMNEGINQLLRYSNSRPEVEEDEGIEHLFHYNQIMVSSWFYKARAAAVGADYEYYLEWKDTSPVSNSEVMRELGKTDSQLKSQELLVAGMLRPAHLLDIVNNFVLFDIDNGKLIKVVPRYQQYRAVHNATTKLQTGRSRTDGAIEDQRGGIVWHTQGSGKSITMAYLVRKMRTTDNLKDFKIVVVTDRTSLESQLKETAKLTGENIRPNERDRRGQESASDQMKRILSEDGPDLVFCMIQKNQQRDLDTETFEYEIPVPPPKEEIIKAQKEGRELPEGTTKTLRQTVQNYDSYPELNTSEKVLLLIDECHRSHTQTLHANLMKALPNCAKVGFTGTPVFKCEGGTESIFGGFIDKYYLDTAVNDEATVKIMYEGRYAEGLVERSEQLDEAARIEFSEYTEAEQQEIMRRYANQTEVLQAPKLIAVKAKDMLKHYIGGILPDEFKAQVVAVSRQATICYQQSLSNARDEIVADLENLDRSLLDLSDEEKEQLDTYTNFLVKAYPLLEKIRSLEFAAIISGNHNDPPSWKQWTDKANQEENERLFKLPMSHSDPEKRSSLAFICVKKMHTVGFNAPREQVLYLDRYAKEHELLQIIARVNRRAKGKPCGYVVDYIGLAKELQEARKAAEEGGDTGAGGGRGIEVVRDELPRLEDRHARVIALFSDNGINDIRDIERCVELLEDEKIRADFLNKLRLFLWSLGIVMPRPQALPYLRDAKILGFIAKVAANLYRDEQLNLLGVEIKVKRLIDEYISAQGIDPRIPPIEITDVGYQEHVARMRSSRARASEMLHAIRHFIRIHRNEDPTHFTSLSQRLEEILQELKNNWDELERVLHDFIENAVSRGRESEVEGLDPKIQAPFFGLIKSFFDKHNNTDLKPADEKFMEIVNLTINLVEHIQQEIRVVDFWRDTHSRSQLETWIYNEIRRSRILPREKALELATGLVDLAKHRHRWLVS